MKHSRFALLGVLLSVAFGANAGELKVGDKAPDFNLESTHGGTYQLGDKPVVLAWFPKAYTRGCTVECQSLVEKGHLIEAFDVDYFMVSCDPIEDNKGFAAKHHAEFPMLSDPTKEVAKAYGVLNEGWGRAEPAQLLHRRRRHHPRHRPEGQPVNSRRGHCRPVGRAGNPEGRQGSGGNRQQHLTG